MLTTVGALLCAGALMPAAHAQSPMPQSPTVPAPYSWPTFHAGGALETALPSATNLPPNPLSFQLQGTPTGLNGTFATEIPSFLLGNYLPSTTLGVDNTGAATFPNHFRDDTLAGANLIQKWSAPYDFVTPAAAATGQAQTGSIVADDADTTAQTYPAGSGIATGWQVSATFAGNWATTSSASAMPDPLAATAPAPPYSYRRDFAVNVNVPNVTNPTLDTATYKFVVPAGAAGSYSAAFHLPDVTNGENRISDAHYVVTRTPTGTGSTPITLFDGRVTQLDANSTQFIAGPFAVAVGDTISVVLDNSTDVGTQAAPVPNSDTYVLADSVSLVPGTSAGTGNTFEGSPTAINFVEFPEIQDAFYYGFAVTRTTDPATGVTTVTQASDFTNPFGNPTIGTQNPDATHRIRQLVYFGRSENIVLTDSSGGLVDATGKATTMPVNQTVGAIYCVDGLTGQTVWRFQTPNTSGPNNLTPTNASAGVFTTPAIARMNVLTSAAGAASATYATKLCVVVADDNGLVYCLDAIGNRNGTSNQGSNNDGTGTDSPYNPTYGQPIYNPSATLDQTPTPNDSPHAHVGNTNAYWIYRPGKSKLTATNPAKQLLPTPQAFGQASPTIVLDPAATTDATTLAPGKTASSSVTATNSAVYIGNSNGTLYKLDGLGIAPNAELYDASQLIAINSAGYSLDTVNTCQPQWWFPINGISTNQSGTADPFSITSAPSVYQTTNTGTTTTTVYVGAGNDINMGHVFAVLSTGPTNVTIPSTGAITDPNYNVNAAPKWMFPAKNALAFGAVTGSPVVFTNPDTSTTSVYFGANVNKEQPADALQDVATGGRIWAVNANTGAAAWAYPTTYDPNSTNAGTLLGTAYAPPIGTFDRSTPAIGIVQFPAAITYGVGGISNYTHTDTPKGSVLGRSVPMLYLGASSEATTGDVQGSNFYALDLDGTTDNERNSFYFPNGPAGRTGETISGANFQTSPLLIVNSTSTNTPNDGHGGAVFLAGTDYILHEVGATYTSDNAPTGSTSDRPQLQNTQVLTTLGGLSSPAAAAFDTSDLQLSTTTGKFVTDWVYCGDSFSGFCRGITPANRTGSGGDLNYGTGGTGIDYGGGSVVVNNAPLHAYIFDDTSGHSASSTDMGMANLIGSALPVFEWGGNVYIRISNVVPPNPSNDPKYWMSDGSSDLANLKVKDIVYSNGNGFTIQLSDIGPNGQPRTTSAVDFAQVPATLLTAGTGLNPTGSPAVVPSGFIQASPSGNGKQDTIGDQLKDATGKMYIAAATHSINDGSSNPNTPGSRRRVLSAAQTVSAYQVTAVSAGGVPTVVFVQTVTLNINTNSTATTVAVVKSPAHPNGTERLPSVDQPTFGILNPLAVRGGGTPIPLGASPNPLAMTIGGSNDGLLGPFSAVSGATPPTQDDLSAFSNGNMVYTDGKQVPSNGILTGDRGNRQYENIITATSDIAHGTSGDNGDPNATVTPAPTGPLGKTNKFGAYTLDIADRSLLGLSPYGSLKNLAMEDSSAKWNDNTANGTGTDAVVNPLPWDDFSSLAKYGSGSNNLSLDYPDIPARAIRQTLIKQSTEALSLNATNGISPDPATDPNKAGPANRTINADTVQVQVRVPKYQPANLQIYDQTNTQPAPPTALSSSSVAFPMGYVASKKVYVKSNRQPRYVRGEAYRTIQIYTGVPVDMTTQIVNQTTDLGKLPQSFGVQTENDNALGQFMPYQTAAMVAATPSPVPGYQQYFKPVTVLNQGNVNLLNVQFDQRFATLNSSGTALLRSGAISLQSDALDPMALIQAYDVNDVTGPRTVNLPGTNNLPPLPFLIRTSLDADLVRSNATNGANYGRNPGIVANTDSNAVTYNTMFPLAGATFHKARVSDASPALLTVPDVPHDNTSSSSPFYAQVLNDGAQSTLDTNGNLPVVFDPTTHAPATDPNTGKHIPAATLPYVGLAVPLGTPVGSYSAQLRLFEGIDPLGYTDLYGTGNYYKSLLPPTYGASVHQTVTANGQYVNPVSTPTVLKATVTETRVTDGTTYGNLPQVDASPTNTRGTADFLPAAFRNTFWNSGKVTAGDNGLSLYWTSARNATPATTNTPAIPYSLIGAHLPFVTANKQGYFAAAANNQWFTFPTVTNSGNAANLPAGINTAISIAPDQHVFDGTNFNSDGTAYAFVQNVQAGGMATAYQNNLYCYQVNTATGSTTGTPVPVSNDTRQPKFGARGLKYDANVVKFKDALAPNALITDNLWAFWNGGTRGRSMLFFSSAPSASVNSYASGGATPFTAFAQALPTPPGLSAVADPTAVLTQTTLASGTVPAMDVTYSGVNADGNTDVYVSRYLPYYVRKADGTTVLTDANGKQVVGLALTPSPAITEQLLPDTARQFYQARDVAWARTDTVDVLVNSVSILRDGTKTPTNGVYPLLAGVKTSYDLATGTLVYTGIPSSTTTPVHNSFNATGGAISITAIYVDLVRGCMRFRTSYTAANGSNASRFDVPLPDAYSVSATFQPQARRITTDRRADTEPVSFLDEAYKPNEAFGLPRVSTARYWYIWRKSAAPGATTTPTLYTKTQRLTLYLHDTPANSQTAPQSVVLPLTNAGVPVSLTLTDLSATNTISSANLAASVDVDWLRGRLYFPQIINGIAVEGHNINARFTYVDSTGPTQKTGGNVTDTVQWLDEQRYNDAANQPAAGASGAVDTTEHAVPIDVAANEGSPSAFLDPMAYADVFSGAYNPFDSAAKASTSTPDQPHKVWLFWNSTRSGTADVFYETIDPRFSANP